LSPIRPGENRLERIELPLGGAATLRIVDELERPLPGALVTCFQSSGPDWHAVAKSVSDADGVVHLTGLKEGRHRAVTEAWNASGADLYLIDREFDVILNDVCEVGILRGTAPFAELVLTLNEPGIGARLARTMVVRSHGEEGPRSFFHCDFPMGRSFRIWTGRSGLWSLSMQVREAGSSILDTGILPKNVDIEVPCVRTIAFEHRHRTDESARAVITGLIPQVPGSIESNGYLALMREGRVLALQTGISTDVTTPFSFVSFQAGEHRLVGCAGGLAFDVEITLQLGDALALGELPVRDPAMCVFQARWPSGEPVLNGSATIMLGERYGAQGTMASALEFTYAQDHEPLAIPVGVNCTMNLSGPRESGWSQFTVESGGSHVVDLELHPLN